jgi:hypothetical protein
LGANGDYLLHKPIDPMALRALLNQFLTNTPAVSDRLQTTVSSI